MKRILLSVLCIMLILGPFASTGRAASSQPWQPIPGPYGGSVAALGMSPDYPVDHTVFAGLRSQGVYRTVNGGTSWQRVSPGGWVVVDLALSPDYPDDQTLFVTAGLWTSGYHVYRSTDDGGSWQDVTPAWSGPPDQPVLALSPAFASDGTLYVAGGLQTFVSTDGGDTFVPAGGWFSSHSVAEIAFSPAFATDTTLFALVPGAGLYKSTDGGTNWVLTGLAGAYSTFVVSPDYADDQMLLAVAAVDGHVYVSHDGGDSWTPVELTLDPDGKHTLAFSPTFGPGDGVILAASSADPGAYRSEDSGVTWMPVGWYDPALAYQGGFIGGSVHALVLPPIGSWDPQAFAGTSSGVYHSFDRGIHWYQDNQGLARLTVRALAVAPGDPDVLLAGTSFFEHLRFDTTAPDEFDGNLQLSTDGGQTWRDVSGRLDRVQTVAFSPAFADDGTAFAAAGTLGQHGYEDGGVYRSIDGGKDWEEVLPDKICRALAVSPDFATDQTLWVSASDYSQAPALRVSTDGGNTWSPLASDVHAQVLAASPNYAADHTLFAGTYDAGLQRSTDAGLNWTPVLSGSISALAISPAYGASQTLYSSAREDSAGADELYRSTDGGNTWQLLDIGIPPAIGGDSRAIATLSFAQDGSVLAGVYYGSEGGQGAIYRSTDGGDTWQVVGSGLEAYNVFALATVPGGSLTFYAGTDGGLWQLDAAQGGPAEPGTWDSGGPRGGRAQALAVSPDFASDGVAFAGEWVQTSTTGQSGLGFFKSSDGGQSWDWSASGTEDVMFSSAVHAFALSPDYGTDGTVFAGTWGGLFRSTDGGTNWSWIGRLYRGPIGAITSVAVAPDYATSGHVLAGGGWAGLFVSQDGGIHWTTNYTVPASSAVAYSPDFASDDTAFATGANGVWHTLDRGLSWTPIFTATGVSALAVSPDFGTDRTLFAGAEDLYISVDGGENWISRTLPTDAFRINALAVSPAYAADDTLFAGTNDGLHQSIDGGLTWAEVATYPGLAVRALAISPGWPGQPVLLVGTDQGVYRTDDGGAIWHLSQGLTTLYTGPLALSPDESLLVTGASRHGVYGSQDRGTTWFPLGLQQFGEIDVADLAFSPSFAADQTMFATATSLGSIGASLYRTVDGGVSWEAILNGGAMWGLALSPQYATDRTVLVAADGQVQRSTDGGETWAPLGEWPSGTSPSAQWVALAPNYPTDRTVLAGGNGFWRLPPGATTWQPAASGLPDGLFVQALAVSPAYPPDGTLLIAARWPAESGFDYHYGILRSTDGGVHWTSSSTGLPDVELQAVAFSPRFALDGTAYATSLDDLYRAVDGGLSWTAVGHPPGSLISGDVVADRDGDVYVSSGAALTTARQGVWRYSTPARDLVVDGGFEADSGWDLPDTPWPAGYTESVAYDGARSVRIGMANVLPGYPYPASYFYSSARQTISIPADALTATLRCHVYPVSGEGVLASEAQVFPAAAQPASPATGDVQYLYLYASQRKILFWQLSNAQSWQVREFDLTPYAGQTVTLHFGVFNDGIGGRTAMYVDDVSLVVWRLARPGVTNRVYLPVIFRAY